MRRTASITKIVRLSRATTSGDPMGAAGNANGIPALVVRPRIVRLDDDSTSLLDPFLGELKDR